MAGLRVLNQVQAVRGYLAQVGLTHAPRGNRDHSLAPESCLLFCLPVSISTLLPLYPVSSESLRGMKQVPCHFSLLLKELDMADGALSPHFYSN